ncbi:pathogenicity island protein [Staphylococcus agnetis]|uniref:hypothetical protein n=1 Tax=Staphylococcus TaxID=1279 RepID=UPI0004E2AFF5|nr:MULTISPECIES: hypothetical protein [Staphylococcus]KFE40763.1 hypothetical protein SAGN_11322 [Staphylococcus agnetis]NJH86140.1 pathogenicity island protein [Staphylococcus agnetis]NJI15407.1 pathogenicity island protein [Staphylococcus agnetis]PTF68124.1 pathogenicity island protein [Staphylococcus chromogenes]PTH44751.1 pathogenicity island protein [Staphylococcus agnetis]
MEEKYIQIIPAPNNLYAIYEDAGEEIESKIIMFALKNNGGIDMLDMDDSGWIDVAITASNFKRVEYK